LNREIVHTPKKNLNVLQIKKSGKYFLACERVQGKKVSRKSVYVFTGTTELSRTAKKNLKSVKILILRREFNNGLPRAFAA